LATDCSSEGVNFGTKEKLLEDDECIHPQQIPPTAFLFYERSEGRGEFSVKKRDLYGIPNFLDDRRFLAFYQQGLVHSVDTKVASIHEANLEKSLHQ